MEQYFDSIVNSSFIDCDKKHIIGYSRNQRPVYGYKFGNGPFYISLLAGCHADEPTGPRLLKHLTAYFSGINEDHELLGRFTWYIVSHANPDGEAVNLQWYSYSDDYYYLGSYLHHVQREAPGDDVEFGFPDDQNDALRPENEAIYKFWKTADRSFDLHISLHGMAKSYGPWFLIEPAWKERSSIIQQTCRDQTKNMGYSLFDIDRRGEKGFFRINPGFATRPDSKYMKKFFIENNQPEMAEKFHPSSMESIRSLGDDCLTLVSEMPLFILPKENEDISWPNPGLEKWKEKLAHWQHLIVQGKLNENEVDDASKKEGIKGMFVHDQMKLQWTFLIAGIYQVLMKKTEQRP